VRMRLHGEPEVGRDAVGDVGPIVAPVVAPIEPPVILQEEAAVPRGIVDDLVDALTELGILVRQKLRAHADIPRAPARAAIVGAIAAAGRHRDHHPVLIRWVGDDGVETQATTTRSPLRAMWMLEQTVNGTPRLAGVAGLKERRGLDSRPHDIGLVAWTGHDLPHLDERDIRAVGKPHGLPVLRGPRFTKVVAAADVAAPMKASRGRERSLPSAALVVGERVNGFAGEIGTMFSPLCR